MHPKSMNSAIDQDGGDCGQSHPQARTGLSRRMAVIIRRAFGVVDVRMGEEAYATYIHCVPGFLDENELGSD